MLSGAPRRLIRRGGLEPKWRASGWRCLALPHSALPQPCPFAGEDKKESRRLYFIKRFDQATFHDNLPMHERGGI